MKGIVYYDKKGKIFSIEWGDDLKGDTEGGVSFLEIDVPSGAIINEVDLSSDPPKIVFTKYPESDYNKLEKRVGTTETTINSHAERLAESEENIINIELAVASIYEGGLE